MKINHIGKIASLVLGVATLSACTTYTGYSSASAGYGYNGGYTTGYNGYNGYADYPPPIVPAVIAPPVTVVEPSVIVSRPAPVIVEERRRGIFGRYDSRPDYRPNYRNGYPNYQRDPRYRDQYHGQNQGYDRGRYDHRQHPNPAQANPATPTTGTAQPTTSSATQPASQNRGDWRNRGRYQQANGMNGQSQQRQRPTYQRPQRYVTPTATTTTTPTPVAH